MEEGHAILVIEESVSLQGTIKRLARDTPLLERGYKLPGLRDVDHIIFCSMSYEDGYLDVVHMPKGREVLEPLVNTVGLTQLIR